MSKHELRIDIADLRSALTFAAKPIERRITTPVLAEVLFEVSANRLTLTGTNLDQWATVTTECESKGAYSFVCGPGPILKLIKGLKGQAKLEIEEGEPDAKMRFEADGTVFERRLMCGPEDFPMCDRARGRAESSFSQAVLSEAFRNTKPSISTDETRYYLNGVYMEAQDDGGVRFVSTDGHRLAMFEVEGDPQQKEIRGGAIIPREAIQLIEGALEKGGNEPVSVRFFGATVGKDVPKGDDKVPEVDRVSDWVDRVELTIGDRVIFSKLIDGPYPDYRRVIPPVSDKIDCTVNREAIRRVMAIQSERSHVVRLSGSDGALIGRSIEMDGCIRVPITANSKDGPDIGFNGRYLKEIADIHPTLRVTGLGSGDPMRVIPEDPRATFVLMPMRL